MLTYDQAIEYLESFINYEKLAAPYDPRKWKLERMHRLLSALGDPHHDLRFIHIAGTKGKGSTAAMIASILQEAGFKAGLYTSPHLISFRERIRINGEMISENQVCDLVTQIKPYADELKKHEDQFGILSFFDVYTALGILFFWIEKVDFAVLEVGMGGRLDATNVVQPLVSVITQISYDHTLSLGNTIESIATEKAGIIKDSGYVITSPQVPEALEIIRNTCAEKKARLFEVGVDIHFEKYKNPPLPKGTTPFYSPFVKGDLGGFSAPFSVSGIFGQYGNLRIPLIGDHQLINAATAVGALELLKFHDFTVTAENMRAGFKKVKWPARVEVISQNPTIIMDVAHNEASAKALRETIKSSFNYEKLILVMGISQHKDIKGIGQQICSIADQVILTKVNNPRALEPEDMKAELGDICEDAIITQDVPSALEKARSIADSTDLICIMGSVYLAGEAMQALGRSTNGNKT